MKLFIETTLYAAAELALVAVCIYMSNGYEFDFSWLMINAGVA